MKNNLYIKSALLISLLLCSPCFAADSWIYKLPNGESVKVAAKPQGKFISYVMTVGNKPPLLLIKIYKTQEKVDKEQRGFIPIPDINIKNRMALFELAINSSASGTGRGQCGAGIEKYLFMVSLLPAPTTIHRIPLESCWIDLELIEDKTENISIVESQLIIKYNYFPRLNGRMVAKYDLWPEYGGFSSIEVIKKNE